MPSVRRRAEDLPEALAVVGAGGFLDGMSFVLYGVFACAQTGNVVIGVIDLTRGDVSAGLRHLPALLAFAIGVAITRLFARDRLRALVGRPTSVLLAVEIVILCAVGCLSRGAPVAVFTPLVAFVGGLQMTTFRSLDDTPYTSTMTTGNLRRFVEALVGWAADRDPDDGRVAGRLGAVIVAFALGAAAGGLLGRLIADRAAFVVAAALALVLARMWRTTSRLRAGEPPEPPVVG